MWAIVGADLNIVTLLVFFFFVTCGCMCFFGGELEQLILQTGWQSCFSTPHITFSPLHLPRSIHLFLHPCVLRGSVAALVPSQPGVIRLFHSSSAGLVSNTSFFSFPTSCHPSPSAERWIDGIKRLMNVCGCVCVCVYGVFKSSK